MVTNHSFAENFWPLYFKINLEKWHDKETVKNLVLYSFLCVAKLHRIHYLQTEEGPSSWSVVEKRQRVQLFPILLSKLLFLISWSVKVFPFPYQNYHFLYHHVVLRNPLACCLKESPKSLKVRRFASIGHGYISHVKDDKIFEENVAPLQCTWAETGMKQSLLEIPQAWYLTMCCSTDHLRGHVHL